MARKRKTPPIPVQVVGPTIDSPAFIKARLIDFDTGSAILEDQHKAWLAAKMAHVKQQSDFNMWLIGFASKLGKTADNQKLSGLRMNAVLSFMASIDARATGFDPNKIQKFEARGEDAYSAEERDNAADMRAVEVHVFIGSVPPPPPGVTPIKRPPPPPLPGGPRYREWDIAAPGGAVVSPRPPIPVVVGFNVFLIRNRKTREVRTYISAQAGVGLSKGSISGLKGLKSVIQGILTSTSTTNWEYSEVTSSLAVTWDEIESCWVTVSSLAGGIGPLGVTGIRTTFDAGKVWRYNENEQPITETGVTLFQIDFAGRTSWQLGASGSSIGGPLIRVD